MSEATSGRRPALTIVLVGSDRLARADFSSGSAPMAVAERPRAASAAGSEAWELPTLVETALALGGRCGKRVFVLAEDAWTQTLPLATAAAAGLDPAQLGRALAFEVEPLSGIPAGESALGFVDVGGGRGAQGRRVFWISEVPASSRDGVNAVVRAAGGKLDGIAHPGGVPRPLGAAAAPSGAWRRFEIWRQATVCLGGATPAGASRVEVINANPEQASWRPSLSRWIETEDDPAAAGEWLDRNGRAALPIAAAWRPHSLASNDTLESWLRAWAAEIGASRRAVPTVVPATTQVPRRRLVATAIGLGVVVVAACVAHGLAQRSIENAGRDQLEELKAPAARFAESEKKAKQLDGELAKLAADNRRAEALAEGGTLRIAIERRRIAALLQAAADSRPDDLVVERIEEAGPGDLAITGVTLRSGLADELATFLSERLAPLGLVVEPAEKKSRLLLDDGGPWDFSIAIRPTTAGSAPR